MQPSNASLLRVGAVADNSFPADALRAPLNSGVRGGLLNQLFALSFLRKQESSAFTFNGLKALDDQTCVC